MEQSNLGESGEGEDYVPENPHKRPRRPRPRMAYKAWLTGETDVPRTTLIGWNKKDVGPKHLQPDSSATGPIADIDLAQLQDRIVCYTDDHAAEFQDICPNIPDSQVSTSGGSCLQQKNWPNADDFQDNSDQQENTEMFSGPCVAVCVCGNCNIIRPIEDSEDNITVEGHANQNPVQQMISYIKKYNVNEPLHPSLKTTKYEAMFMILNLAVRHGMTEPFIIDMLDFVNAIIGCEQPVLRTSYYLFNKIFPPATHMQFHFVCSVCQFYLGEQSKFANDVKFVNCDSCGTSCPVRGLDAKNYFVTLSIRSQLELMLRRPDFKIIPHLQRSEGYVTDLMDGELYHNLCLPGMPLSNGDSISVTFNTDGVAVYSSSHGSLWPIQLHVNEIPPAERFKSENIILAGLWFGKSAPNMSVYLKPFVDELRSLAVNGVQHHKCDGSIVHRSVSAVNCSVDSQVKPKIQNMKQYNGRFSCGYCLHPNPSIRVEEGHLVVKKRLFTPQTYRYRTHAGMISDMLKADELDRLGLLKKSMIGTPQETYDDVRGLKGLSPLLLLPSFNIVYGFAIDYMHCILEGVIPTLVNIFCDSEFRRKDFYLSKQKLAIIDCRLSKITPPQNMSRHPRAITDRGKWKAREWRSFLLFFSLPCMKDLLPPVNLDHLKLLVTAVFTLLKDSISHEELVEAEFALQKFVTDFVKLYGLGKMTYNIHLCSHLAYLVRLNGPLWANSNFPFESGNGHLLKMIQGTRGVIHQVGRKYLTVQCMSEYIKENPVSESVLNFCSRVISYSFIQNSKTYDDVTVLGTQALCVLTQEEERALANGNVFFPNGRIPYYNRAIRNGILYYSRSYKKPTVFDDTCVLLSDNSYGVIDKIFQPPGSEGFFVLVKAIRISTEICEHLAPHIKACAFHHFAPLKICPFSFIVKKCIMIAIEENNFVCHVPNTCERD